MVTGLSGTGLVLQDNGGANLPVSADGPFTFTTDVTSGGAYKVTVLTQPSSPAQTCAVTGGSGTASANVTSVQVACTASNEFGVSSLKGTYVFSLTGIDQAASNVPTMLGSLTANGAGGVTGGTVDLITGVNGVASPAVEPITGGSYSVGTDGRGQIKFDTTTSAGAVTFTLDFVLTSSSHGLVMEDDSYETGSGTIDLQSAITQSQLAGSYTFAFSGTTAIGASPIATVGAFTLDSTGAVSTGQEDVNNAGAYSGAPSQILTSSAVTLGTTPAKATISSSAGTTYTFDVYPIDSSHLKFFENDSQLFVSGDAYTQGSSIPPGQLVFTLTGEDTIKVTGLMPITSGVAYAQTSTTLAASQGYGLNVSALTLNELNKTIGTIEEDAIAEFTTTTSGLSGFVDFNSPGMLAFDQTLTGSFPATVDNKGRGTATTKYFGFNYYVVNGSTFLLLVNDLNLFGTEIFELQNAAGSPGAESGVAPLHPAFHAHAARQQKK